VAARHVQVPTHHDPALPLRVVVTADDLDFASIRGYTQSNLRFHCCCCPDNLQVNPDHANVLEVALSEATMARDIPAGLPAAQRERIVAAVLKASAAAQEKLPCQGILRALQALYNSQTPIFTMPQSLIPPRILQPGLTGSVVASFGSWVQAIRDSSRSSSKKQTSLLHYDELWRDVAKNRNRSKLSAVMLRNVISWQVPGSSHGAITMMHESINLHRSTLLHSECTHLEPERHGVFCPRSLQVFADLLRGQFRVQVCCALVLQLHMYGVVFCDAHCGAWTGYLRRTAVHINAVSDSRASSQSGDECSAAVRVFKD